MADILDLNSLNPEANSFTVSIDRAAKFDNTVDFYEVDADGNVIDADGNTIASGEDGYTDAAIANRLGLDLSTENGVTSEVDVEFTAGRFYAPVIAVDSDFAAFSDSDASNDPTVYFTYEAANVDGFDHVISSEEGQFSFEDLPNGGDKDFNDIVLNFEAIKEPEVQKPEVEEPVDETPEVEEPEVEEPEVEEPEVEEPEVEEPEVQEPEVEEPVDETPEVEEPEVEEPEVEEPEVEEPEVEEPVGEIPEVEEPEVEEPVGDGSISGLKFDDLNGNGIRDSELIQGADPDVVFVIDVSGSTRNLAVGTSVGNRNDDSAENTILDAEIAGFTALNQQLIDQGLGDIDLGVVAFTGSAQTLITTTPNADSDDNGTLDVVDALSSLRALSGTNYGAGLAEAQNIFESLETESGNGNLVFLSDGEPNSLNYEDELDSLKDLGVNLSAFGAGEIDEIFLENLQIIDPDAQIFTTTDQILNVFGDFNSDADGDGEVDGGGSQSELEPTLSGVTIYLDINNNGSFDEGEPSQETDEDGEYVFEGLAADTYTVREVVPDGFTPTTPEEFTITLGEDKAVEDVDFGNITDEALAMLDVELEM